MVSKINKSISRIPKHCPVISFNALMIISVITVFGVYKLMENSASYKADNPVIETIKSWKNYIADGVLSHDQNCNFEDYVFGSPTDQTDPCLIAAFKRKFLIAPPSPENVNRDTLVTTGDVPSNTEKFKWVEKLLIKNTNENSPSPGFYIECGANDGEFISPTIRLEKIYNWSGLLIEANPGPFQSLLKKKRNAYAVNAAVCTKPYPEKVSFFTNPNNTGLAGLNERDKFGVNVKLEMQCIPLYTMLAALDINVVDYLSLDVEGLELEILKTFPFDKIQFKVMTIEHWSIPGGKEALRKFLEPKGYRFVKAIQDDLTQDSLYVHASLFEDALNILKHPF